MTAKQLAALTLVAMPLCAVAPAQDDAVLADLLAKTGDAECWGLEGGAVAGFVQQR